MEDMLSILHKPSMLHSAVVHLPIALCTFGLGLLVLAAILYRNQTIRAVAAMTYGVAAAAAYVAAISGAGANAHVPVNIPAIVSDIRDDHMDMGVKIQYAAAVTGLLVLLSLARWHNVRIAFTLLAIVAGIGSAGLVAYTGHLGGKLVYEHGIGTPNAAPAPVAAAAAPDAAGGVHPAPAPAAPAPDLVAIQPIDLAAAKAVSYSKDIKPILNEYCMDCHDAADADGSFDVRTIAAMTKGGDKGGPGIVPGKPDESSVVQYIRGEKLPRMPKKKPALSVENLHLIRQWIAAGAIDDSPGAAPVAAPAAAAAAPAAAMPAPAPRANTGEIGTATPASN